MDLEILENSTMSEEEKLRFKAVNNGIVVPSVLIESKNLHFVKETIDNNYYHYYEYVYDCLVNKKIDKLYKFFIDNDLERQANDLLEGPSKYPKILEDCWGIFNSSSRNEPNEKVKMLKKYQNDISSVKNGRRLKSTDISNLDDNEIIKDIKFLKNQIFTDTFNKIQKEKQIDLDKLEREKFVNTFTRKSFEDLLINNDRENFIIRLCMLLDAILKYDYKCAGNDFYTRLNNFINLNDIDNENSVFKDNVECKNIGNHLNRLRITRNNIVHFARTKVKSLSDEELRQCLDFTFSIIKRGI